MTELARMLGATPPPGGSSGSSPRGQASAKDVLGGPDVPDVLQFLAQAWLSYMASGVRYWSRIADAWARTLPLIARTLAEGGGAAAPDHPEARAVLMDELRARLRDLADYPAQESRHLQTELDRIASSVWPAETSPDTPYWRRWEAKP